MQSGFRVVAFAVDRPVGVAFARHSTPTRRPQSAVGRNPAAARRRCCSRGPVPGRARGLPQRGRRGAAGPMRAGRAAGVDQSALRVAEFELARDRGRDADQGDRRATPSRSRSTATRCGRRACSRRPRAQYQEALARDPELARGRHGMARSLAARSQLDEAMDEAQAALRLSPRDLEIHHTVGAIYERMHKYEEAAAAYTQLRQPAAEQGPQRQGRLVARRRSSSCARSASACRSRWSRAPRTSSTRSTSGW